MSRIGHRVLLTGGARSGKSELAEERLGGAGEVLYVATGPRPNAEDTDWQQRVRRHRERRPAHWRTMETDDLVTVLADRDESPVLIDCLGNWLASVMDRAGCWDARGEEKLKAEDAVGEHVSQLLTAWRTTSRQVVAVTNEVGSGVIPETATVRWYRDELGRLNTQIAQACDEVWLVTVGIGQRLK